MATLPIHLATNCFDPKDNGKHMVIPFGKLRYVITNNTALNEYPYYTEEIMTLAYVDPEHIKQITSYFRSEISGILKLVRTVKLVQQNIGQIDITAIQTLQTQIYISINQKE